MLILKLKLSFVSLYSPEHTKHGEYNQENQDSTACQEGPGKEIYLSSVLSLLSSVLSLHPPFPHLVPVLVPLLLASKKTLSRAGITELLFKFKFLTMADRIRSLSLRHCDMAPVQQSVK